MLLSEDSSFLLVDVLHMPLVMPKRMIVDDQNLGGRRKVVMLA